MEICQQLLKLQQNPVVLLFYGHGVVYRPTVDRCRLCSENSENIVTFCHIFESVLFSISGLFTAIFLPRDEYACEDYAWQDVCPSIYLSHAGTLNLSSNVFITW